MLFAPPIMGTGDLVKGAPFSASGGWETGEEGWEFTDNITGRQRMHRTDAGPARNGSWAVRRDLDKPFGDQLGGTRRIWYAIPAANAAGLRVRFSVWHRHLDLVGTTQSTRVSLSAEINDITPSIANAFLVKDTVSDLDTAWRLFEADFICPQNLPVRLWLSSLSNDSSTNRATRVFDDWSVSTELP